MMSPLKMIVKLMRLANPQRTMTEMSRSKIGKHCFFSVVSVLGCPRKLVNGL